MNKLLAQILFHGAAVGEAGLQGLAQAPATPPGGGKPPPKKRKGCTPCAAKKEAARLVRRSGV
jgi:hypothetical protein